MSDLAGTFRSCQQQHAATATHWHPLRSQPVGEPIERIDPEPICMCRFDADCPDHGRPEFRRSQPASEPSLDVAWKAAEAACEARGLILEEVAKFNPDGWWQASAWEPKGDVPHTTAVEKGVVAALTKLAARLSQPTEPSETDQE